MNRNPRRNPYGWDYPPGTEFHPDAPWNQKEETEEEAEARERAEDAYWDRKIDEARGK